MGIGSLADKVIVVTGGAGTLGRAFCTALASEGAIVIVGDVDLESANCVARDIEKHGLRAKGARLDITNSQDIKKVIDDLMSEFGKIDGLVNSAYPRNSNFGRLLFDVEYEDFCENLSSHVGGYFMASQQFGKIFQAQKFGSLVNISSIYGLHSPRFELYDGTSMTMPVEYAAIKSAVVQLTMYFASFFLTHGVRCNVIAPGGIRASQPPSFVSKYSSMCGTKGLLDPEDITGALIFLLSDSAMYITGQVLVIDDGWSL